MCKGSEDNKVACKGWSKVREDSEDSGQRKGQRLVGQVVKYLE